MSHGSLEGGQFPGEYPIERAEMFHGDSRTSSDPGTLPCLVVKVVTKLLKRAYNEKEECSPQRAPSPSCVIISFACGVPPREEERVRGISFRSGAAPCLPNSVAEPAMRRLLLLALVTLYSQAQRTFQNTQFDISGDLPAEDPTVLAQAEGVPTHINKNDLKPVKLQKPVELAISAPLNPQGPAAVQPLQPTAVVIQPFPTLAPPSAPAPVAASLPPFSLPTPPTMPTFAPFTLPTFTFPSHPTLPTLAPFTFPTLPPHPTPAPFTFPTAPPPPGSDPVPQLTDYDEPAQKSALPTAAAPTVPPTLAPVPTPAVNIPGPQQQQQPFYFSPEYLQWVSTNYPDHYRQNYQYYVYYSQPRPVPAQVPVTFQQPQPLQAQAPLAQQPLLAQTQPLQLQPPQPQSQQIAVSPAQIQVQPQLQPTVQGRPLVINMHPSAAGVATVAQGNAQTNVQPQQVQKVEHQEQNVSPSRAANWFREQADTSECRRDLKKVAKLFKSKFPAYLQKGGKDAALADLVEKRLIECDEKSGTGHWDKVDGLLSKIQLSKSEESDCRSGLIQERISCQNLLNFSCQFTNNHYQFKLVPARIVIQEARQAEGGAEKCRKVVRLVKKRLEG